MAWTTPATACSGDVITAAFWNTNARDNLNALVNARPEFVDIDVPQPFGMLTSVVSLTANTAYFVPIKPATFVLTLTQILVRIGTASGNIDCAIYSWDGSKMTRVATLGSTACPTAATRVALDIADTPLTPGVKYYLAFAANNGTMTMACVQNEGSHGSPIQISNWAYSKASSFPLPSTVTSLSNSNVAPQMLGLVSGGLSL